MKQEKHPGERSVSRPLWKMIHTITIPVLHRIRGADYSSSQINRSAKDVCVCDRMQMGVGGGEKKGRQAAYLLELWSWKSDRQVSEDGRRDAALLQVSLRGVEVQDWSVAGRACPSDMINKR